MRSITRQLIDDIPDNCKTAFMVNEAVKAGRMIEEMIKQITGYNNTTQQEIVDPEAS